MGIMTEINFTALLPYVLAMSITPGPGNISSASMGLLHGYKNTLNYLLGLSIGMFLMMIMAGSISHTLIEIFPAIEKSVRAVGAAYITWLAIKTLKATYTFEESGQSVMGFGAGFTLTFVNPKVIIYALTLYSTFLAPIADQPRYLILSALFLCSVTFSSVSAWALFGWLIKTHVHQPKIEQAVNVSLALLLGYTAIVILGITS